jgi:predicted alpha/beta-fold hydrolase
MSNKTNWLLKNSHINTIWSSKFRKVATPNYKRTRIATPDDDFLDLDTVINNNKSLVILIHGLEGCSSSTYMKSLTNVLVKHHYDVLAINLRGCSGEHNKVVTSYNSGRTADIVTVINYVKKQYNYEIINIVGFSLGGNIAIKYAGEHTGDTSKVIGISVPCDLKASCHQIEKGFSNIYNRRFVKSLKKKIQYKVKKFPSLEITSKQIAAIKTVYDFDNTYTAPVHGYIDANDYYQKCSSKYFISNIKTPTLLINAIDDPFLTLSCFPYAETENNEYFTLETPKYGGHVGFMKNLSEPILSYEKRILEFLKE